MGKKIGNLGLLILLATVTSFCSNAYTQYAGVPSGERKILYILLQIGIWTLVGFVAEVILARYIRNREQLTGEPYELHFDMRKQIAGMVLCWLPYLLVFAPGLVNYDTVNQLNDFFDGVSPVLFGFVEGQETVVALLNDHHPVFVTLLFSLFLLLGKLVRCPGLGIFLYCLCQMIFGACIFVLFLNTLKKWGIGKRVYFGIYAFLSLSPFVGFYMATMLKNTLHAIIFVWYLWYYLRMINGEYESRWKKGFLAVSLLLCLTQKTGIWLVLLCDVGLLLQREQRRHRRAILLNAAVAFGVMFLLLPKVVFPILQIYPGGKQEILGTCFQQTAKVVYDGVEEVSKEERQVIDAVFDYDRITELYDPHNTDNIKATFRLHASTEDIRQYLGLWIRWGIRHPIKYLYATLNTCGGYFAPVETISVYEQIPSTDGVFAEIAPVMPTAVLECVTAIYTYLTQLPGVGIAFQAVVYTWWIPLLFLGGLIMQKRKRELALCIPIGVNILFLVVSPVYCARYALPLFFAAPFLIGVLCRKESNTQMTESMV